MGSLSLRTLAAVCLLRAGLGVAGPDDELLHEVRATHDVSSLPLHAVGREGGATWLLIRVTPSASSGLATMTDYEDKTGGLRHGLVVVVDGAWEVLSGVNARTEIKGGGYHWETPIDRLDGRRPRTADMYYSPFARHGGMLLCRHNPGAKGAAVLEPMFLMPPPWEKAVLPAYAFCKKAPQVLDPKAPLKRDTVVELLNGDNPLLAVMAFRRLLESNALAPEVAEAVLRSARAHKRAVVTYMVLVLSDEPRRARLVEAVRSAFAGCEGADEARPLAVGAFAAALFHARTERIASPGRALLRDLRTRLTNDGQAKVQDPVLQRIFGLRGLDTK